jgi:McrBC 5-methylcytosine restriction system component
VTGRTELADLTEGQVLETVKLSLFEAAALNATRLVTVQPAGDGWRVTAAYAVGTLRCADLVVRVRPKVGELQVLRLLARAHGLAGLNLDDSLVPVQADPELTSVLAVLFAREATTALATGPFRGYRSEDHTLNVLRGRVRLREQELRRFGQLVPLEVTFDEWTADTDENRRIGAATRRLLALGPLPVDVRDRLLRVDRLLADVQLPPPGAQLRPWLATRLNLRLHRLLQLADLVLAHSTIEHRAGGIQVHGYVLSMSWLFERLVTQLLGERPGSVRVVPQRTSALDAAARLTIKPDFVFLDGPAVVAVADTKYKLLDDSGKFPNADAYQLITYCARLGLDTGHLIYAAGDPCPDPYEITGTGVRLAVHAVDLAQDIAGLEQQIIDLFDDISRPLVAIAD